MNFVHVELFYGSEIFSKFEKHTPETTELWRKSRLLRVVRYRY